MHVVLSPSHRVVVGCLQLIITVIYLSFVAQVMAQEDRSSTPQPIAHGETAVSSTTNTTGGVIAGTIQNGTTGQPLADSLAVNLYAFNSSYTRTDTHITTLDKNGRFQFGLTDQPANQVYMIGVSYNDIEFTSDIGSFTNATNTLTLPVTVYEQTTDSSAVIIDQLHVSLAFMDGEVQVHELYTFDNVETAVFTGSPNTNGTIALSLPANAAAVTYP